MRLLCQGRARRAGAAWELEELVWDGACAQAVHVHTQLQSGALLGPTVPVVYFVMLTGHAATLAACRACPARCRRG